jgi:hypothetical protein
MKEGLYINSVVTWNGFWSHAHQFARTMAAFYPVMFFTTARVSDNPHSGLYERNRYAVPEGVRIVQPQHVSARMDLGYLLYNQWFSLRSIIANRSRYHAYASYNFLDLLGLITARLLGKKTVFMFIDEYDVLTRWPSLGWLFRIFIALDCRCAHVVVCTAQTLCERARRYNKHVQYLPNAVDSSLVQTSGTRKPPGARWTIGYVGSLGSWVDGELIVKLAHTFPEHQFTIVGDGAGLPSLIAAQKTRGLANLTLPGHVSHDALKPYLESFDLALIPFIRNTITDSVSPIKLFEYWTYSLPVVARETRELAQFAEQLFLYTTHEECVAHIRSCIADLHMAAAHGSAGNELVRTRYNWQNYGHLFRDTILA